MVGLGAEPQLRPRRRWAVSIRPGLFRWLPQMTVQRHERVKWRLLPERLLRGRRLPIYQRGSPCSSRAERHRSAAAELRVAASDEPENAAALRRLADQLEAQADDLDAANSRAKPVGFSTPKIVSRGLLCIDVAPRGELRNAGRVKKA